MRLTALFLISLNLGCSQVPPYPEVWVCVHLTRLHFFRCENTKTKEKITIPDESMKMDKSICLSIEDYKKSEDWVQTVKSIAEKRCN